MPRLAPLFEGGACRGYHWYMFTFLLLVYFPCRRHGGVSFFSRQGVMSRGFGKAPKGASRTTFFVNNYYIMNNWVLIVGMLASIFAVTAVGAWRLSNTGSGASSDQFKTAPVNYGVLYHKFTTTNPGTVNDA